MTPTGPDRSLVGVLGGTFDPVHLGHIAAARFVRDRLSLERILLVPCSVPPLKSTDGPAPAEHRLRMLDLAVAGEPGLVVSRIEIDRGGISYTIDTLRALRDGAAPVTPVFVLGVDALADLTAWRSPDALVDEFDLVAITRPGRAIEESRRRLPAEIVSRIVVPDDRPPAPFELRPPVGGGGRIILLDPPPVPVSSSEVRDRARRDLDLEGLVPPDVGKYIRAQRLYREEAAR